MRFSSAELEMLDAVGSRLQVKQGGTYSRSGVVRWFLARYPLPTEETEVDERVRLAYQRLQEES